MGVAYDRGLEGSDCVFCGQCVAVCPTGALTENKALGLARAWETGKVRTTCPYCGVGCQLWLHVKDGRITKVTAVKDAQPNRGRLCVKGRFGSRSINEDSYQMQKLFRACLGTNNIDNCART